MSTVESAADILVVDDERTSRSLLVHTLNRAGLSCRQTADGESALSLVEERLPDLILLDYSMPGGLNGAEVCQKLRAHTNPDVAQIPVIMLTGMGGEEQEVYCLEAGASDFVAKPLNANVLLARIQTQLRLHALRHQLEQQNLELATWRADLERDLEAARLTQQTIIPQSLPKLPNWDFASHYQPVIQVGGDVYDWLHLPNGNLFFWIADATGHGASAALLTALAKLLFRHAAAQSSSPAQILDAVNAEFRATFKGRSMLTAMGVSVNRASGELIVAGAGHPPLLISRVDGSLERYQSQIPPLGLQTVQKAVETQCELKPGEGFLLYTDGFYDVLNPKGERLEFDAFECCMRDADVLQPNGPRTARISQTLLDQMMACLHRHADGSAFADDLAAVAAFRLPAMQ